MLLPRKDQKELLKHMQVFLKEKKIIACGGLDLTDEIKIIIAANACLLLLHRNTDYFPNLSTILVYPKPYNSKQMQMHPHGWMVQEDEVLLGESWAHGTIVLTWSEIKRDSKKHNDGKNLILHEFTHQLDDENTASEGVPMFENNQQTLAWARVFTKEYESLITDVMQNKKTLLDEDGANSPAEFFAVTTEAFFEKPVRLKQKHPELYDCLKSFFKQDPVEYFK